MVTFCRVIQRKVQKLKNGGKRVRKRITQILALTMILSLVCVFLVACGSSSGSDASGGSGDGITIFNSKMEIQDQMLQMAEKYTAETGVPVEVYYSSDTVSAHLATRYASNNPYTLSLC